MIKRRCFLSKGLYSFIFSFFEFMCEKEGPTTRSVHFWFFSGFQDICKGNDSFLSQSLLNQDLPGAFLDSNCETHELPQSNVVYNFSAQGRLCVLWATRFLLSSSSLGWQCMICTKGILVHRCATEHRAWWRKKHRRQAESQITSLELPGCEGISHKTLLKRNKRISMWEDIWPS